MNEFRMKLLEIADGELGQTNPAAYWLETTGSTVGTKKLSWCGVFALWCLREAGLCTWAWLIGKGFLYRLPRTTDPQPGDLAYFDKPYQHHAIVQRIEGDNVYLIQGNYGTPGRVAESVCSLRVKKPVFYSIEGLISTLTKEVDR